MHITKVAGECAYYKYTDKGGLVRLAKTNNKSEQENLFMGTEGIAVTNGIKNKGFLQTKNML